MLNNIGVGQNFQGGMIPPLPFVNIQNGQILHLNTSNQNGGSQNNINNSQNINKTSNPN